MPIVEDILSFCYNNNCTPDTVIFDERENFDKMDDIVENWHRSHVSFLDTDKYEHNLKELWNLRSIVLGSEGDREVLVDVPKFEEERLLYHRVYELLLGRMLTLPEISVVSYKVECHIKKVNLDLIFKEFRFPTMVYNGMRKLPSSLDVIPEWMLEDDKNEKNVIYTKFKGMNIRIKEQSIIFKYDIDEDLDDILEEILTIIGTHRTGVRTSKFISISEINMTRPWKKHIMADIITNDAYISQIASVQESSKLLYEKRYLTSVCLFSKFTIIDESGKIIVRVSSPNAYHDIEIILLIVLVLFEIYEEVYENIDRMYSRLYVGDEVITDKKENNLKALRKIEPSLFINNYTRECPILPIIVNNMEEVDTPCILYHGRYYTAPIGYYVGLKVNRLSNKNKYQYLITCYRTNHMTRGNSITYRYIHGETHGYDKKYRSQPTRKINSKEYPVTPQRSFLECVELSLGKNTSRISEHLHLVCKQELWYMDDKQIRENIEAGKVDSSYYRYYEELYSCNILTIVLSRGEYDVYIPHHRDEYLWDYHQSNRCILIIEIVPPPHTKGYKTFELVPHIFSLEEKNVCSKLLRKKANMTTRSIVHSIGNISEQYIDNRGRCTMVRNVSMKEKECNMRPLACKTYIPAIGMISEHLDYINRIRRKNDMDELIWDESNHQYNFFPNLESAITWRDQFE